MPAPRLRVNHRSGPSCGFGHCCVFYTFVFFIFVCSILILIVSVTRVKEYQEEGRYLETTCKVQNIVHDVNYTVTCEFCEDSQDSNGDSVRSCRESGFPCVEVWVEYIDKKTRLNQSALLHSDIKQLDGISPWCSFTNCLRTFADGEGFTLEKRLEYEAYQNENTSIPCFYKSKNSTYVVAEKLHTLREIVHWYLWPIVINIVSILMIILLAVKFKSWASCCSNERRSESPMALTQPIVARRPPMATSATQTTTDTAIQTQPPMNPTYPQQYSLPSQPSEYEPIPPPPPYSVMDPSMPMATPTAPPEYDECKKS